MNTNEAHRSVDQLDACESVKEEMHDILEELTGEKYEGSDGVIPYTPSNLEVRTSGRYLGKAIFLFYGDPMTCDRQWRILKDDLNAYCLVCFKAGKAPRRSDI